MYLRGPNPDGQTSNQASAISLPGNHRCGKRQPHHCGYFKASCRPELQKNDLYRYFSYGPGVCQFGIVLSAHLTFKITLPDQGGDHLTVTEKSEKQHVLTQYTLVGTTRKIQRNDFNIQTISGFQSVLPSSTHVMVTKGMWLCVQHVTSWTLLLLKIK